ncbi:hypothetical protein [Methanosarcina sp. 2.H.T.1A.15]|uniref:hypothetical protein n=1 Tax=Methanosarcina sp. 2.H.T.1A.15 TaxID=1483596 RepID=UPI0006222B2E|nr:hypothetical protein [Methanosarcina sp. 2.H.T.1A.15]KKG19335.1 hypothetical protein EO97_04075 [Methanosarcina sp. 2.H.T.1A.15]
MNTATKFLNFPWGIFSTPFFPIIAPIKDAGMKIKKPDKMTGSNPVSPLIYVAILVESVSYTHLTLPTKRIV